MKKQFFFMAAGFFLMLMSCFHEQEKRHASMSSDNFRIEGTIAEMDSGKVLFSHYDFEADSMITDTVAVKNDTFTYTGVQNVPALYSLRIAGKQQQPARFFVENAKITFSAMKDSISGSDVTGSASEDMYKAYLRQLKPVKVKMDEWQDQYMQAHKSDNEQLVESLEDTYNSLVDQKKQAIRDFVHSYPESVISAWAVARNFRYSPDPQKLSSLYEALDTSAQHTVYGKQIKETLDIAKKLAIGNIAPDFTQTDINGNPLSLSDLRGKYVLIDFWASWCGPCRQENPNVVEAYNKYKDEGFTVLGVSLDEDKGAWEKAIENDDLHWYHVSDLKGWKNAVAQQYGIKAIPSNILIDPDGKILAKNLRGDELQNKLAEIFNK